MKTIILFLVLSLTCYAQQKLLREYGDFKTNQDVKKMLEQISKEQPIINTLEESKLKQKPFSANEVVNFADLDFTITQQPSQKFSVSGYNLSSAEKKKMVENLVSDFNKQNLFFHEGKKLINNTKQLDNEILQTLFEK